MTDPLLWQDSTIETRRAFLHALSPGEGQKRQIFGHFHRLPDEISQLRLYAFAKARCGAPNGLQTFFRDDSVDNLIQWDFVLEDETFVIELIGLNYRTEIRLWAFVPFPEPAWAAIEESIRHALRTEAKEIGKTISSFEKWHLFLNPHAHLSHVAEELEERLKAVVATPVSVPDSALYGSDHAGYTAAVNRVFKHALETTTFATVLSSIAPVLGESAVNLLLHLTAHDSIRRDSRLLESALRSNIDVRIKRMSVDCRGLSKEIDASRPEFKDFLRLMNRRNDVLHGNVDVKKQIGDSIYFDQRTIPLVEQLKPLVQLQYEQMTASASAESALADLNISRSFVAFLIEHYEGSLHDQLELTLGELHLGFRPETGRIGVILPRSFVDMQTFEEASPGDFRWIADGI